MSKVSVIVPVYNVGDYLKPCIESVLLQTLEDLELILVNDGSTDNSGAIIDEYANVDRRIKAIHKSNEGVTITRKRGLNLASGEYILFLDGDDYLELDALEQMCVCAKKTNADWVVGDYYIVYPDRTRMEHRFMDFGTTDNVGFLNYCYSNPDFYFTGRLIRRDFLLSATATIPPGITYGEDNLAVTQYASQLLKAAKVNTFVLNYVQRGESVTNRMSKHDLQMRARAIKTCWDFLKSLAYYEKLRDTAERYFVNELCSFIIRGYYDDNLHFALVDCKMRKGHGWKNKLVYTLAQCSPAISVRVYRLLKTTGNVLNFHNSRNS